MSQQERFLCDKPFSMIELHPDGNIYPCCPAWCKHYSFGNVFEENSSFESIWNSQKAQEFRKSILDNKYTYCNREMCQEISSFNEYHDVQSPEDFYSLTRYPKYVKFCHDNSCNIRCVTCRDTYQMNSSAKAAQLDALIATHLLPLLKDAETVSLNGSGELFASRHCRRLTREISTQYPDITFAVHTNGILCDEKNCAELGILEKIRSVQVSVHAATHDTYRAMTRTDDFDRVMKNVAWLSSLKKDKKIDELRLVFVVSKLNYQEMKPFMEMAIRLDGIADFWEYRPWNTKMAYDYESMAVFDPRNKHYGDLARILQDDVFKHPNCCVNGVLRAVDPQKTMRRTFKDRVVDLFRGTL